MSSVCWMLYERVRAWRKNRAENPLERQLVGLAKLPRPRENRVRIQENRGAQERGGRASTTESGLSPLPRHFPFLGFFAVSAAMLFLSASMMLTTLLAGSGSAFLRAGGLPPCFFFEAMMSFSAS